MFRVKFADIGEGVHEGVIHKIHVKPGDKIEDGDTLMAIETDKVTADIPAPVDGTVLKVFNEEGETVHVGQVIVEIDDGKEEVRSNMKTDDDFEGQSTDEKENSKSAESKETSDEEKPHTETVTEEGSTSVVGELEISSEVIETSAEGQEKTSQIQKRKVLATPVARKMAKDLGIDIQTIKGTGPAGRVLKEDIQSHANKRADQKPEKETKDMSVSIKEDSQAVRVPMSTIRKTISENMTKSKYTIPHTAVMDEADVTDLVNYRKMMKPLAEEKGVKLTYMPFIIKSVVTALKAFEMLNASLDEQADEIVFHKTYNIGMALDTPQGLMVPVIHGADQKSILELADVVLDLSQRGKEKKLTMKELSGGTFTITNYGAFGSSYGVPIIRYPEAAILGIGAIAKKPVVRNDEIVIRSIMPLSMSFDHRIMDGADAGRFIAYVKSLLENPQLLLLS